MVEYNMMKTYLFLILAFIHVEISVIDEDAKTSNNVNKVLQKIKAENYETILDILIYKNHKE